MLRMFAIRCSPVCELKRHASHPAKPEQRIECTVRCLYLQFGVENNQWIDYRVENCLRVFPFVNRLVDTCAKSRDICECEHRPRNLPIVSAIGGNPNKKTSIAVAAFDPMGCPVSDHPRADSIEILHARKSIANRTTDIRGRQTKHRRSRAVDARKFCNRG